MRLKSPVAEVKAEAEAEVEVEVEVELEAEAEVELEAELEVCCSTGIRPRRLRRRCSDARWSEARPSGAVSQNHPRTPRRRHP